MRFRFKNFGCINIFLSGLVTAIAINYLISGFVDIVLNVDKLIQWLEKSGLLAYLKALLGVR